MNNPLTFTDPSGLNSEDPNDDGFCLPCDLFEFGATAIAAGIDDLLSDLFNGQRKYQGSFKPRPTVAGDPAGFGENLGLPTSMPQGNWGLSLALNLPQEGCEFGPCGPGTSGQSFGPGEIALGGGAEGVCIFLEPCGAVEGILAGIAVIGTAIGVQDSISQMSKGGKENVGHDYVRDLARAAGGDYCSALKAIVDSARSQETRSSSTMPKQHTNKTAGAIDMTNEQTWFIAELVMEITVADDPRNVVHRNHVLISASSNEEAYSKACGFGRRGETSYNNPAGKVVQIRFVGIADLDGILDPLEDGAEVLFRYTVGVPKDVLNSLIPDKKLLRAFAARRRAEGPDYASAEVVDMIRTTTGFDRPS